MSTNLNSSAPHISGALTYNDLAADRQVVAAIQAMEAILARAAKDAGARFARGRGEGGAPVEMR